MKEKEVLIIIPAYNEAANIGKVLDQLEKPEISDIADILVMNDASVDATNWLVKARGHALVTHVFNLGYGSGIQLGYKYAVRRGYKYVIQMDADGQHDVCNIPLLYNRLRQKDEDGRYPDIVLGARFMDGSGEYQISAAKRLAFHLFRFMMRIAAGSVLLNVETRQFFAYVPQGNTILAGTIAENLRMVKENASDEEVEEALKVACAWDFVEKMPKGINTALGERGRGLSEGQAQRIAIARAVLRDAPILLLDEATSALDVTTERRVLKNIITQRPNKTCIVTTHRPSVLNLCKRVYRVVDTKVTELSEEESAKMAMDF